MSDSGRLTRRGFSVFAGLWLAGCSARAASTNTYVPPADVTVKPSRILVADFAASPGIVQLDTSPGVQLQRSSAGITPAAAAAQDVQDVQSAISDTLVQKITAMGLVAQRVPEGTQPGPGEALVTGQVTEIDEGNRARRTVVGFGAGQTAVKASAALLLGGAAGAQPLQTYNAEADSGHMPGLGIGAAAGGATTAISGAAHAAGEVERTPVGDQAANMAGQLATDLKQYFVAQGWISGS